MQTNSSHIQTTYDLCKTSCKRKYFVRNLLRNKLLSAGFQAEFPHAAPRGAAAAVASSIVGAEPFAGRAVAAETPFGEAAHFPPSSLP
jgi:hypothetical protein